MPSLEERLRAPLDSPIHLELRDDCVDGILGRWGACCYYLSVLLDDCFVGEGMSRVQNAAREVLDKVAPHLPSRLTTNGQWCEALRPVYETEFRKRFPQVHLNRRATKEDAAILLLAKNPTWGDDRIARETPTTIKQLARFSWYQILRRSIL